MIIQTLIADDEVRFRNYMLSAVDWFALGYAIKSVVSNGLEAVETVESTVIDAAFLDINMPFLNGLKLARKIRELSPNTIIVFITGYSSFEYAREALKIGVEDYLLKPFSPEELTALLKQIHMKAEKLHASDRESKQQAQLAKNSLLNDLISHSPHLNTPSYDLLLKKAGINFDYRFYLTAVLEINYFYKIRESLRDIHLWKFSICNLLEELYSEKQTCYIFHGPQERIIIIYAGNNHTLDNLQNRQILMTARDFMQSYFSVTFTAGLGSVVNQKEDIPQSYANALHALQHYPTKTNSGIISYYEAASQASCNTFYKLNIYNQLLFSLRMEKLDEIKIALREVQSYIIENHIDRPTTQLILTSILSICFSYISEHEGSISDVLGEDAKVYQTGLSLASLQESFSALEHVFSLALAKYSQQYPPRAKAVIEQVRSYIDEHYNDADLTPQQIANTLYLDSSYIRKILKKYLKCSLSDLILTKRMEKARVLLEDGTVNITLLASNVGYNDPNYFSKSFKRYYGQSPREYMQSLSGHSSI